MSCKIFAPFSSTIISILYPYDGAFDGLSIVALGLTEDSVVIKIIGNNYPYWLTSEDIKVYSHMISFREWGAA